MIACNKGNSRRTFVWYSLLCTVQKTSWRVQTCIRQSVATLPNGTESSLPTNNRTVCVVCGADRGDPAPVVHSWTVHYERRSITFDCRWSEDYCLRSIGPEELNISVRISVLSTDWKQYQSNGCLDKSNRIISNIKNVQFRHKNTWERARTRDNFLGYTRFPGVLQPLIHSYTNQRRKNFQNRNRPWKQQSCF